MSDVHHTGDGNLDQRYDELCRVEAERDALREDNAELRKLVCESTGVARLCHTWIDNYTQTDNRTSVDVFNLQQAAIVAHAFEAKAEAALKGGDR